LQMHWLLCSESLVHLQPPGIIIIIIKMPSFYLGSTQFRDEMFMANWDSNNILQALWISLEVPHMKCYLYASTNGRNMAFWYYQYCLHFPPVWFIKVCITVILQRQTANSLSTEGF
jgi:hypothetical protein